MEKYSIGKCQIFLDRGSRSLTDSHRSCGQCNKLDACPFLVGSAGAKTRPNNKKRRPPEWRFKRNPRSIVHDSPTYSDTEFYTRKEVETGKVISSHESTYTAQLHAYSFIRDGARIFSHSAVSHLQVFDGYRPSGKLTLRYHTKGSSAYDEYVVSPLRLFEMGNMHYCPRTPWEDVYIEHQGAFHSMLQALQPYRSKSIQVMTPSLTTGFSLPVFTVELLEFKTLFKDLFKMAKQAISSLAMPWRKRSIKDITDAIASGHLTWSFGIAPFISDVTKLLKILASFDARTKEFIDRAQKLESVRHWRCSLPGSLLREALSYTVFLRAASVTVVPTFEPQIHHSLDTIAYNATLEFDYSIRTLIELDNSILGLFQQLGIKPDATILWELIPFSFVVDWFTNAQEFISAHASLDVIWSELNIHCFMESFRGFVTYSPDWRTLDVGDNWTVMSNSISAVSFRKEQFYFRYFAEPKLVKESIEIDNDFDLRKLALSASLTRKAIIK